ncbi:MAG TPA: GNAT family N-acetyltransferase, partial [Bacteroidia bacterium]|nr:GNAT family N-acetyltransferase [Bacteroidia bacterium]
MTKNDADEIFRLRSDKKITEYLDRDPPKSIEEIYEWVIKVDAEIDENRGISWGMYLKGEPKLIGSIGLWRTVPEHHYAEIGYSLLNEYQRKGLMFEAMIAALKYGFNEMQLHRVEAN